MMDEKDATFFYEGDGDGAHRAHQRQPSSPIVQNFSRKSMPRPRTFSEATEPQRPEYRRYPSGPKSRTSSQVSFNRFAREDAERMAAESDDKPDYQHQSSERRGTTTTTEARQGHRRRTPLQQTRDWWPEVLWCLLTIGLFVALVVVLVHYNNKRLPEWPLGLTLNTAVAALATAARSVIIIPVTEGISQLKWNWFVKKERPVRDLLTFDQASRGPWGSFRMMVAARGRTLLLATIASLVLLSGLVTSFVTQSSISYSTRLVVVPTRTDVVVRHARSYPPRTSDGEPIPIANGYVDDVMRTAFQAAFYPPTQSWPKLQPDCPSGECRWPLYESLAICSITKNITDQLTVEEGEEPLKTWYNATLLDGSAYLYEEFYGEMSSTPSIINMTSPDPETDSVFDFPLIRESLVKEDGKNLTAATISQFFLIYTNNNADYHNKDNRYRAAEILWYFCVNQYNTTVHEGQAREDIVASTVKVSEVHKVEPPLSSKPMKRASGEISRVDPTGGKDDTDSEDNTDGGDDTADDDDSDRDEEIAKVDSATGGDETSYMLLDSADGSQKFNITATWDYTRLDKAFRRAFSGDYSTRYGTGASYTEINEELGKKIFNGVESNLTTQDVDDLTWGNLERMVTNIAQATTNFIQEGDTTSLGEALQTETFVLVRWEWLAFLAAQVGLAVVFLLAIIATTARLGVDVVKSNNLTELFATGRHRQRYGDGEKEKEGADAYYYHGADGLRPAPRAGVVARLTPDENGVWGLNLRRKEAANA